MLNKLVTFAFLTILLSTSAIAEKNSTDIAKLYNIGQGRHLYLKCSGKGTPTVILESGYRNDSDVWTVSYEGKQAVFPVVASFTRVCVYDRPGTIGWTVKALSRSDKIIMPRSVDSIVEDFHDLLHSANIKGPIILVGHSLGGIFIRLYASRYPNEIAGLILVDAYSENVKSLLGPEQWKEISNIMASPPAGIKDKKYFEMIDFDNVTTVMEETAKQSPLKPMPLTVISRGQPADIPGNNENKLNSVTFEQAWQAGQNKLLALSPYAKHIIAKQSQHYVQFTQPQLIIDAIRKMVYQVRKK